MVKTAQMQLSTRPAIPLFDRASAFLASVLIFSLTCSLIFMQNLVAVSHIVSTHVGPPFFWRGEGDAVAFERYYVYLPEKN